MCNKLDVPSIHMVAYLSAVKKAKDYIVVLQDIDSGVRIMDNYTEKELQELEQSGRTAIWPGRVTVLGKIDTRGKDFWERYRGVLQLKKYIRYPGNASTREEKIVRAKRFAEEVQTNPYICSINIIGSVARDEDEIGSDIDLLVLTNSCPGKEQCSIPPYGIPPLEIFCHTVDEFEKLERENPFVSSVAKMMVPLFER